MMIGSLPSATAPPMTKSGGWFQETTIASRLIAEISMTISSFFSSPMTGKPGAIAQSPFIEER